MLSDVYIKKINEKLKHALVNQKEVLESISKKLAESIENGAVIHLFGCGHSHMLVEEVFYRAGGLVPISPIFETGTMLHEGAVKSSEIEKFQGYAKHILNNYDVKENEIIFVISNSGINSLPIEMAIEAKSRGLYVIAMGSSAYREKKSRHPDGKSLYEVADIFIDNQLPYGDALVEIPGHDVNMGPGSTIIGAYLLNILMIKTVEVLTTLNKTPPVFMSGNIDGGYEYNEKYISAYKKRIKHL